MKLRGGIHFNGDGIQSTVGGMSLIQKMVGVLKDNVAGFNKVGYQRNVPIVSSFAEYLGPHGVSVNKKEEVGKIKITQKPLDVALGSEGYFQVQTENGVNLTRDGRFSLDKEGYLLNLQGEKVISSEGVPLKLKTLPKNLDDIRIDKSGEISYKAPDSFDILKGGQISVVSAEGERLADVNIKQGYVEQSNVTLPEEIFSMMTLRRDFTANKELFRVQNEILTKTLQELGRA